MSSRQRGANIDFLCIGAEKAATTWLAECLSAHPGIFVPRGKELHYFNEHYVENPDLPNVNHGRSLDWYMSFFANASPGQKRGELSPSYLWDKAAAGAIHDVFPKVKIIAILRNPVQRSISQFWYYRQKGIITRGTFEEAIREHEYLLERSRYRIHLSRYYGLFPESRICIRLFDDILTQPEACLHAVQDFIGVERQTPDVCRHTVNETQEPSFPRVARFLTHVKHAARKRKLESLIMLSRLLGLSRLVEWGRDGLKRPAGSRVGVKEETLYELVEYFKPDVAYVEQVVGRDLSSWKHPGGRQ